MSQRGWIVLGVAIGLYALLVLAAITGMIIDATR